jgi:hypothetical protein
MADKGWLDGVPWVIAVAGWAVTHVFSEMRERRKESRSHIDKAYEALSKVTSDAHDFHTAAEFNTSGSRELISKLHRLERMLSRVGCFEQDGLTPAIIRLRRSVTLKNFDGSDFKLQPPESEILEAIDSAAEDVEDEMERQYRYAYPSHFPFVRLRAQRKNEAKVWPK